MNNIRSLFDEFSDAARTRYPIEHDGVRLRHTDSAYTVIFTPAYFQLKAKDQNGYTEDVTFAHYATFKVAFKDPASYHSKQINFPENVDVEQDMLDWAEKHYRREISKSLELMNP